MSPSAATARHCDPRFAPLLSGFDREALETHPGSICGLWRDLRIAYVNPAWRRFAEENGGRPGIADAWGVGACYMAAVPDVLRPRLEHLFERAVEGGGDAMRPAALDYECSSARIFRMFHMDVYPLPGRRGYLVVNSLVVEEPHDPRRRAPRPPDRAAYLDAGGLIQQCSHCRRVRHPEEGRWDWIPAWVEAPPDATSHSICRVCFDYFYPEDGEG